MSTVATSAQAEDRLADSFASPPARYGMVPFYWWTGEPLSLERIAWQLDQLKANGVSGVSVNYTHTVVGDPYRGDPPLFSDAWWAFWESVVEECARRDMAIGFDDYLVTHGHPELATVGAEIRRDAHDVAGLLLRERGCSLEHGDSHPLGNIQTVQAVTAVAYRTVQNALDASSAVDLLALAASGASTWQVPEGTWYVCVLHTEPQPFGPMNPLYAEKVIEYYFARFEKHSKGLLGKAVDFFFQDELTFGGSMPFWSDRLPAEFLEQKGYDLLGELTGLFHDIGPRTPKIRLDYYDVAVGMMEEHYYRPLYEWCQERDIIYGHDQTSRADVITGVRLYGDYFRTLRWYQAPGTDRIPNLTRGKVCSSIAQLYDRPRVWFEAYHSTGWGVTPTDLCRWDSEVLLYGYNLLSHHSLYYTTLGGWWSWAPGDIHFRQPYWSWMKGHYLEVQRMCYLLSQGEHRCDVAVLFPTSMVQADMAGTTPGPAAREAQGMLQAMEALFKEHGIDFGYIDDQSLMRASAHDGVLEVSGGVYRVLVLPAVKVIREGALDAAFEFYRQGGMVVALGAVPEASDRIGREDPILDSKVEEIFGPTSVRSGGPNGADALRRNAAGGIGCLLRFAVGDPARLAADLAQRIDDSRGRDFVSRGAAVYVMHRRLAGRDVYALYNPQGEAVQPEVFFRVVDKRPESWDPWSGSIQPIRSYRTFETGTEMSLSFEPYEIKVVVFADSAAEVAPAEGKADGPAQTIPVEGPWAFTVEPILDNRWGDFRSPPTNERIAPEARQFRHAMERTKSEARDWQDPAYDDSSWPQTTASFGPRFWLLGPIARGTDVRALERELTTLDHVDPDRALVVDAAELRWRPLEYSLRWGLEEDPLLVRRSGAAIHGPIGWVPEEFIHLQTPSDGAFWYLWTSVQSQRRQKTRLAVGTGAALRAWHRGSAVMADDEARGEIRVGPWSIVEYPTSVRSTPVDLCEGGNPLLVKLQGAGEGTIVRAFVALGSDLHDSPVPDLVERPSGDRDYVPSPLVASRWYTRPQLGHFDAHEGQQPRALWYRFKAPPGLESLTFVAHGEPRVWVEGDELEVEEVEDWDSPAKTYEQAVAYRARPRRAFECSAVACIRLVPLRGYYAGAALPEAVRFDCGPGRAPLGDWSGFGLSTYSGAARYARGVSLSAGQINGQVLLCLGDVAAAARVEVNGREVGSCLRPPWRVDISSFVRAGENRLEIIVANTLANHYSVGMPCGHRFIFEDQERAGLFGPVTIEIRPES